jgi:hypothetical protein
MTSKHEHIHGERGSSDWLAHLNNNKLADYITLKLTEFMAVPFSPFYRRSLRPGFSLAGTSTACWKFMLVHVLSPKLGSMEDFPESVEPFVTCFDLFVLQSCTFITYICWTTMFWFHIIHLAFFCQTWTNVNFEVSTLILFPISATVTGGHR